MARKKKVAAPPTEIVINEDFSYVSPKDGKTYTLTLKEKLFCEKYLEFTGNGLQAVMEVYDVKSPNTAAVMAHEYLRKPNVIAYVNSLLEQYGFNDDDVEKQHLFLLNQHSDFKSKTKAVELFYRLKGKLKDSGGGNKTLVVVVSGESAQRYGIPATQHTETSSA